MSTWKHELYRNHMPIACIAGFIVASILSHRIFAIEQLEGRLVKGPEPRPKEKSPTSLILVGENTTAIKVERLEPWIPVIGANSFESGKGLNPAEVRFSETDELEENNSGKPD